MHDREDRPGLMCAYAQLDNAEGISVEGAEVISHVD